METSPWWPPVVTMLVATSIARNRSLKLLLAASTRTMCPLGAIACAHSMSSAASCAQPQFVRGWLPEANTTLKHPLEVVHDGNPNCLENTFRSLAAVG